MVKIFVFVIALTGFYCCVDAQSTVIAKTEFKQTEAIKSTTAQIAGSNYNTGFTENYKVCMNENGYLICSENTEYCNAVYMQFIGIVTADFWNSDQNFYHAGKAVIADKSVPQSQPYVNTPAVSR